MKKKRQITRLFLEYVTTLEKWEGESDIIEWSWSELIEKIIEKIESVERIPVIYFILFLFFIETDKGNFDLSVCFSKHCPHSKRNPVTQLSITQSLSAVNIQALHNIALSVSHSEQVHLSAEMFLYSMTLQETVEEH